MKFSIAIATFAAFAAMSVPYASAQTFAPSVADSFAPSVADSFAPSVSDSFAPSVADSFAPSVADSFAPSAEESNAPSSESSAEINSPSAFGSIAPSFESVTSVPSASAECSAYPACSALALEGDCCPTIDNIVLACCSEASFVIGDSAAPSSEVQDSASPSSEVGDIASPSSEVPTPSPSNDEESSAPSDSPAASLVTEDSIAPSDADEEKSSAPSSTATSILGPPQSTPPADLLVSLTPIDFEGCIEDEDNVSIDKIFLRICDSTKQVQKFKYDGALMRTGSNEDKCLQAGYTGDPAEGEFVRVVDCDLNNSLQKFTWDYANNGFISLTDYPGFCMSFRGMNDNVGADPILMKKCELTDFQGTMYFKWGISA